jgi:hypothetical protein
MTHQCVAMSKVLVLVLTSWTLVACLNRKVASREPNIQTNIVETINQARINKVDLLFVIDNSGSMRQEQKLLKQQIRIMVEELISPTVQGPHTPLPVEDLHLGIVSTDLGVFCKDEDGNLLGDNGELQNSCTASGGEVLFQAADCEGDSCPWFVHSEEYPDDDQNNAPIWEDFGCVAELGTNGCGIEQPLEAARRALDPAGHGAPGGPNGGFLRSDSLLAIVFVTDEDDCSTNDSGIVEDSSKPELACVEQAHRLIPVQQYYNFFVGLRGGDGDRVVVAAITGLPRNEVGDELLWNLGKSVDILRQFRDREIEENDEVPAICTSQLQGTTPNALGDGAAPPVRLAQLIEKFGMNAYMGSICRSDWSEALRAITRKIQAKLDGVCVSRTLASTSPEVCRVIETRVDDAPCPNLLPDGAAAKTRSSSQWRRDLGVVRSTFNGVETNRRECEILATDYDGDGCPDGAADCQNENYTGSLNGWFYDSTDADCPNGQVRFTSEDTTGDGSTVRLECLTALCPLRRLVAPSYHEEDCDDEGSCSVCPLPPTVDSCPEGEVAVQHSSGAMCGFQNFSTPDGNEPRPCSCQICTPIVGSRCPRIDESQPIVANRPLIESGGCCAVGFHWDYVSEQCEPDRVTPCE